MIPLRMALAFAMALALFSAFSSFAASQPTLKLMVQRGYLPGLPVLVRVDRLKAAGEVDRAVWDAEVILSTDPTMTLSTNRVMLRNGRGSALVTINGSGDFELTAVQGELATSREVRDLSGEPVTRVGVGLSGTATTWSGVIQVTNDLTIQAPHTLTILSNTLILVNGVASGTAAPDILNFGTIQSLGTEDYPVTITCATPGLHWGQIRHNNAQPSVYRYTSITRAGRGTGEGHTGTCPALRPTNSRILFDHCNFTDFSPVGKIMQGSGSDLTFAGCIMSRARMGPELQGGALLITNSHLIEFRGADDADALYVHTQAAGQRALLTDSVVGYTDDDGLDTLNATMRLERSIFRNMNSGVDPDGKGISIFNGTTHLSRCLIADCITSVSAKWSGGPATLITVNECTILGTSNSVVAAWKDNAPGPFIDFRITNSILRSRDAVKSDFGPTNFTIRYCNISEDWPGDGNQTGDPRFVGGYDFHLQIDSPCIDAGNPASGLDPDGSRMDIGTFTLIPPRPILAIAGAGEFVLQGFPNRNYVVEYSTDLPAWNALGTFYQTNDANLIHDSSSSAQQKFYRARLAP